MTSSPTEGQSGDWRIVAAGQTDVGRNRSNNEDAFGIFHDVALYLVADGMGGHAAGEIASSFTVETIHRVVTETAEADLTAVTDGAGNSSVGGRRLLIALKEANTRLLARSRAAAELRGMGTTVAALVVDGPYGCVAVCHVGDSRVYRIRDRAIEQLTEDHTVVQHLINEGQMRPEERQASAQRHVLTQAVGAIDVLEPGLRLERPRPQDVFVLCTDGVHDAMSPEEMCQIVLDAGEGLEAACRRLIELANARGGKDNGTVVVVSCSPAAASGPR